MVYVCLFVMVLNVDVNRRGQFKEQPIEVLTNVRNEHCTPFRVKNKNNLVTVVESE